MKTKLSKHKTSITLESTMERREGEQLERKIERLKNNGEGIEEGLNTIYQAKKDDGVNPLTDPRTDLMLLAIDHIDTKQAERLAVRKEALAKKQAEKAPIENNNEGKSAEPSQ